MENRLINAAIKRNLTAAGYKNVSVRQARGTASGWKDIVVIGRKHAGQCDTARSAGFRVDCAQCHETTRTQYNECQKIAADTIRACGETVNTFCSDDGFGTDRECINVSVRKELEIA